MERDQNPGAGLEIGADDEALASPRRETAVGLQQLFSHISLLASIAKPRRRRLQSVGTAYDAWVPGRSAAQRRLEPV